MTSEIEGSVLTQQGIGLIGKLLRAKSSLKLTRACVGDGIIDPDDPDVNPEIFTDLIHYTSDVAILGFADSENGEATIMLQATSIGVEHGYFIREAAVYAEDPDEGEILYAYAALQVNPLWIRPEGHTVTNLTDLNITIIVDRIETVTVNLSTNGLVTMGILNQRLAPLEPNTNFVTLDHSLDTFPQIMLTKYQYGAGIGGAGKGPAGGTNAVQVSARAEYLNRDSLIVYTTENIAKPETTKEIHKISDYEYIVTYDGDDASAVYIQLMCVPKRRLEDYLTHKLATLHHGLGAYPQVMAGTLRYGAGRGAVGNGPAGGTDLKQLFVRVEYQDRDALTIYTTEDVARPDVQKDIYRAGDYEYAVTYKDDGVDSVHIQLITGKTIIGSNMGLKILEV